MYWMHDANGSLLISLTCTSIAQVYSGAVERIVASVLQGYNGTVFAYGQTGAGKTHTMEGSPDVPREGLMPLSFQQIFAHVGEHSAHQQFLVRSRPSAVLLHVQWPS